MKQRFSTWDIINPKGVKWDFLKGKDKDKDLKIQSKNKIINVMCCGMHR